VAREPIQPLNVQAAGARARRGIATGEDCGGSSDKDREAGLFLFSRVPFLRRELCARPVVGTYKEEKRGLRPWMQASGAGEHAYEDADVQ